MGLLNVFKKKDIPKPYFSEWTDLPGYGHSDISNEEFIKNYNIVKDKIIFVHNMKAKITKVKTDLITVKYEDDKTPHSDSEDIYFNEFNEYKVAFPNEYNGKFMNILNFGKLCKDDDYEGVLNALKNFNFNPNGDIEFSDLKMSAQTGNFNTVKAFVVDSRILKLPKVIRILSAAADQGYLKIVKLLVENGVDPSGDDNRAIKVVGDNNDVREYLLKDQRVINKLIEQGYFEYLPKEIKDIFIF